MRACPICANHKVDVLHSQQFALPEGHPLGHGYDVVCCRRCGFVYANTEIAQSDYDIFYAQHSKYEDKRTATGGVDNHFDVKRQRETADQIARFLRSPDAKILDVGCANGGILKALKDIGYENLCGIDPSDVCVENTRSLGIEAFQGTLSQPFAENAYDCLILSHTLEHVQDLDGAVRWIKKRLQPKGTVYIETPDAARYVDFVYSPFQDFNTEHINHFSLQCLENLMAIHGFISAENGIKDLVTEVNMFYPAIFGFWRTTASTSGAPIQKDETLRLRIKEYIHTSKQIMQKINAEIAEALKKNRSIIVWGTGQLTMKLLLETSLADANILTFVDNNPMSRGAKLNNKPIVAPEEIANLDAPILIATLLHHEAIARQIKSLGFKNEIIFLHGEQE